MIHPELTDATLEKLLEIIRSAHGDGRLSVSMDASTVGWVTEESDWLNRVTDGGRLIVLQIDPNRFLVGQPQWTTAEHWAARPRPEAAAGG